jgi:predicted component of type VI protein secretion system
MRIGPYELRRPVGALGPADERPPEPTPLIARSYGREPWPEVGLEFLNGPSRSAVWPMNRVISLVGSAAGCKFRLADPSVSPFHCSLVRTHAGLWVVDLLGGGGVEVNNAAVRHAPLVEGDELAVGRYRIRIRSRSRGEETTADDDPGSSAEHPARTLAVSRGAGLPATIPPQAEEKGGARGRSLQSVTVLPAEIESRNLGESAAVLVPLMNQFGMMQQQMMDQFQNAMGMLVEMFGTLQREQMDLIRQELDQLREVTREFQDLKTELAAFTREREAAAAAPSAPLPADPAAPATPAEPTAADLPAPPVVEAPQPAPSPSPTTIPGPVPGPGTGSARTQARPRRERPAKPAEGGEANADADVMLWLNQRIATLQEERESRWQKILKLLPGSS